MDIIGIKVISFDSMAKCISIIRKYDPISMGDIKRKIENKEYVLQCNYIDGVGIRKVRKCYDELTKNGATVEIYEHERLSNRAFISNLINTYAGIAKDVERQMQEEADEE